MVVPLPPSYPPTGRYVAGNAGYREAALGTKTIRGQNFQILGFQKNRPKKFYRFKSIWYNNEKEGTMPRGSKKQTTQQIIKRAKRVHGDRYDYSETEYINHRTKIKIICKEHGDFMQLATGHIRGYGCPSCVGKARLTTAQFIQRAKSIHGDRYDYSKVVYIAGDKKVNIICPEHGSFLQKASNHINMAQGCRRCAKNQISEPLFREVLEKIFVDKFNKEYKFPNTRPEWLRNPETGWPLELDCYNEELELAFELHGRQHYEPIEFFGGEKTYIKQYRRDLRTRNICWEKGVTLFTVDGRPVSWKKPALKQQYYKQEILKCLAKVPEKIKIKLLEANKQQ